MVCFDILLLAQQDLTAYNTIHSRSVESSVHSTYVKQVRDIRTHDLKGTGPHAVPNPRVYGSISHEAVKVAQSLTLLITQYSPPKIRIPHFRAHAES
jgi:hypothetical protein